VVVSFVEEVILSTLEMMAEVIENEEEPPVFLEGEEDNNLTLGSSSNGGGGGEVMQEVDADMNQQIQRLNRQIQKKRRTKKTIWLIKIWNR